MIRRIDDFLEAWKAESEFTLKIFRVLTDASLAQKVTPEGRTLGFLAWHIATSLGHMAGVAGLPADCAGVKDPQPATAAEIADAYQKAAECVGRGVKATWTDAQLSDEIPMFGQTWPKSKVLSALIAHQCHHRGQMTVLMRQAGLRVPGVYGPAKEEWAAMGMPALP